MYAFRIGLFTCLLILFTNMTLAAPVPVIVTITSVGCTQNDECDEEGIEALGQSTPDFYAKIFINGALTVTPRAPDDRLYVEPGWTATAVIDDVATPKVPINIQIWDHDSTSGDDLADGSPQFDHNNLDLVLDVASGAWSGDGTTSCITGDGVDSDDDEYYPVKVCFDIVAGPDSDGDGLLDNWEQFGFDADGDGTVDINLPLMGANPLRADVFLELDYEAGRPPTRNGIAALKRAFALAPVPNPDGSRGVNLHVDVGNLVDATADEAGVTGTCSNGIDDDFNGPIDGADASCARYVDINGEGVAANCANGVNDDADGLIDGADPDCLVGDNFGGGQQLAAPVGACALDAVFATAKAANFSPNRARIFHYAIQAAAPVPSANCAGGQGEIGGNDFISHNRDAGTLMHELGHNLGLRHGGNEDSNCKPNYVSVMNYNLQAGIPRPGGGRRLDYSPPRQALDGTSRSGAPLANLVEDALVEALPIDPGDITNQTVFMDATNRLITLSLSASPNYSGDIGDPPFEPSAPTNIDNGIAATPSTPAIGAAGCANTSNNDTLEGANDWASLRLKFREDADSGDGVVTAQNDGAATEQELEDIDTAIRTTDLQVMLGAGPDPVAAGTALGYTATVLNAGPNPANAPALTLTFPPQTQLTPPVASECTVTSPGIVRCIFPVMPAGASRSVTLNAAVPADLVYLNGAPLPLAGSALVEDLAGFEENPADNSASVTVTAVAVADLSLGSLSVDNPPLRMKLGEDVVINLSSSIGSNGPSSPMDTTLQLTATADAGASASPTWLETGQVALRLGETREVDDHMIISCRERGIHVWEFAHRIDPTRAPDSDPDGSDNSASTKLEVECLARETEDAVINVQPGQWPNAVPAHGREASIAILTTAAGEYGRSQAFDAAAIDTQSVRIGTRRMLDGSEPGTQRIGETVFEDSFETGAPETVMDDDRDLVLRFFDIDESGLLAGDVELCVTGFAADPAGGPAVEFSGCDAVTVVP